MRGALTGLFPVATLDECLAGHGRHAKSNAAPLHWVGTAGGGAAPKPTPPKGGASPVHQDGLLRAAQAGAETAVAGPIGGMVAPIAGEGLGALRRAGLQKVNDILADALLNPGRAAVLPRKAAESDAEGHRPVRQCLPAGGVRLCHRGQ